jgi:hypothetical protein
MQGPQMHPPVMAPPGGIPEPKEGDDMAREVPRNRNRPPESDEMRAGMPKQAAHKIIYAYDENGEIARNEDGSKQTLVDRPLSAIERGPSSYGRRRTADFSRIDRAVSRRERLAAGPPRVSDLIKDPDFYQMLNMGSYEGQIMADFPEIAAGGGGESRKILEEMLEHYEEVTGVEPVW